jgi:hypothetical protein
MSWHQKPDREAIKANKASEPEGERLRASLERWLKRNKVVGVLLETDLHTVEIQSAKLPPRIKPVLTKWGSIYVEDSE